MKKRTVTIPGLTPIRPTSMLRRLAQSAFEFGLAGQLFLLAALYSSIAAEMKPSFDSYTLGFTTPTDAGLQRKLEVLDARLRERYDIAIHQTAVGALDLKRLRLAMIDPD